MKKLAVALMAAGAVYLLIAALHRPEPKHGAVADTTDRFAVRAVVDGKTQAASVSCEGDITGAGYLAEPVAAFKACTFDKVVSVHQYLQHRAACADLIRDAATVADRPLGKVTITGVYFDAPLSLTLDAQHGSECDKAAWKLLGPLLP